MNKVGVIILNYKVKELVFKCVESVKKSTFKDILIIIVDNNSQDGLGKELEDRNDLIFIQNPINSGYAGGNNIGIRKALELGYDYIFILNPDTTVDPKAVEFLIEGLEKYSAAAANPKIYFGDSETLWFAGKIFDLENVLGTHRGVDETDRGQYDRDEEIEDATGAALMVKKEVFEQIGLFDERYFLYYEDTDFAYRARKKGFKIMYLPKAKVCHENAQSTGLGSPLQDYYITRNRMLFASKFLNLRTRFALFKEAMRNLGNHTRRRAFFDFLMGNLGKGSI